VAGPTIDPAAQEYIDAIAAEHRPLFDRVHGIIVAEHPEAEVGMSYGMPTPQGREAAPLRRGLEARALALRVGTR
jgi:hypothetical protein